MLTARNTHTHILINDITAVAAAPATGADTSYCRSISAELQGIQGKHPAASKLPLDKKQLNAITTTAMTNQWVANSTVRARALKPSPDPPRYLTIDDKPVVCIRARLRLSVALTPQRKFRYRHTDHDQCCGETGTTEHVLLRCSRFAGPRAACTLALSKLSTPVHLTLDLVFSGSLHLPPPHRFLSTARSISCKTCTITAWTSRASIYLPSTLSPGSECLAHLCRASLVVFFSLILEALDSFNSITGVNQ